MNNTTEAFIKNTIEEILDQATKEAEKIKIKMASEKCAVVFKELINNGFIEASELKKMLSSYKIPYTFYIDKTSSLKEDKKENKTYFRTSSYC